MAGLWEFVGDTIGETLGAAWLGPVALGGVIAAVAISPETRHRVRKWGVKGMAAAMAARELATKRLNESGGTSGLVNQFGQRMVQAAAEMREEWDDFLAEARSFKEGGLPPGEDKHESGNTSRPRRRAAKSRTRRASP